MQLDRAGRLADDHADGLPEADVAVVGSVRIGAAAVRIRIAAECRNNRYACIIGRLKKAGFERQDFTAFGTGAFGENGNSIAVFQCFGHACDFGGVAFDAAVARDVNRLCLRGEITDHRPFGHIVFSHETAGKCAVDRHNV